jgi:uncharacterized protein
MTEDVYFFDTYALFEIIGGSNDYKKYLDKDIVLTKLNIFEIYQNSLNDFGGVKADEILENYYEYIVEYPKNVIKEAAKLRLKFKKRDLSMTDCIGYVISKRLNIKFLTGDKEFEDFENVEFVK